MKIYTKTGDLGETGLLGGKRVNKSDERVSAYGEVDELVSLLGLICSICEDRELIALLQEIQLDLFSFNSELATMPGYEIAIDRIQDRDVEKLEYEIDRCDRELPALTSFILPGGSPMASSLQLARSVCRRAERAVVRLALSDQLRPVLLRYLNRLSDLLFSLGRLANYRDQHPEVLISTLRQQRIAHSNFDKHRDDF